MSFKKCILKYTGVCKGNIQNDIKNIYRSEV